MTTVWVVMEDDGACGDPECCGPSRDYVVAVFATEAAAKRAGYAYSEEHEVRD